MATRKTKESKDKGIDMGRQVMIWSTLCIVLLGAGAVEGQPNPYMPAQPSDAWARRARREQAVMYAGPGSRDFVESFGEDAVAAIFACSPAVARQFAEYYGTGGLDTLPRPRDLLRVVGHPNHGDRVARFALGHAQELTDIDLFNLFVANPLEYTLGLRYLQADAAQLRARRLQPSPSPAAPGLTAPDLGSIAGVGGIVGIIVLLVWWKRRQ